MPLLAFNTNLSLILRQARCVSIARASHAPPQIDANVAGGKVSLHAVDVQLNDCTLRVVKPEDVDAVMDWYIDKGEEDKDPYWSVVWASALAMSNYILSNKALVQGKRVGEIGCGLGIAGVAAAKAGARSVAVMDREACALQCALLTAAASGVPCSNSAGDLTANVEERRSLDALQAHLMKQSKAGVTEDGKPESSPGRITAVPLDWNLPHSGDAFDVVIACDVLYESFSVSPLAALVPSMLSQRTREGRVLLTDPPVRAPANRIRFLKELSDMDSEMVVEMNKLMTVDHEGHNVDVQVIVLRRRDGRETVGLPLSSVQ